MINPSGRSGNDHAAWDAMPSGRLPDMSFDPFTFGGSAVLDTAGTRVIDVAPPPVATPAPKPAEPSISIEPFLVPSYLSSRTAAVALPSPRTIAFPPLTSIRERAVERLLEMLPFTMSLVAISSLVWGAIFLPLPFMLLLLTFDVYWFWRSFNTAIHVVRGQRRVKRWAKIDWRGEYENARARGKTYLRWQDVRHVVLIPTYKESIAKLGATLARLAESEIAGSHLIVLLAMEEAEEGCRKKALMLHGEFAGSFAGMYATFHPVGIPGEVKGKSSNEAWAARQIKRHLVDERGLDIRHLTITSCDADTLFHPNYFSCLTHKFATNPNRYRRFWQGPVLLYNNISEVPAPLRLPNALGSLNHIARLTRRYGIVFPQSTYSLSLKMADDVGYWDVDVVPEDWHMFLKCFYSLKGEVEVEQLFLPVGNDGVRVESYLRTFKEHYQQARRHAWGCSDVPYALRQFARHPEIPFVTRLRRTISLIDTHFLWSSQWFLVTLGLGISTPRALGLSIGSLNVQLPIPGIELVDLPDWFGNLTGFILLPCILPLVVMVAVDVLLLRPNRPQSWRAWALGLCHEAAAFVLRRDLGRPCHCFAWLRGALLQIVMMFLMAPTTFLFAALPSLDSQLRLALGKRLEYKVTEKA